MIICHIDTKPISYSLNPLFVMREDSQFDWAIEGSHKVTGGNALPYGLTLVWNVSHQDKSTGEKLVECGIQFRMDFDVENDSHDTKELAGYLYDTLSQVQAIIKFSVPEHFELLKPVKLDYEGRARIIIRDIIKQGCYGHDC